MAVKYQEELEKAGYNVQLPGAVFFGDLVDDVIDLLVEGKNDEEIKELLPRYYVDYYHFYYEVGKKRYFDSLNEFFKSRNQHTSSIIGDKREMKPVSFEDSLLVFAKDSEKKEGIQAIQFIKE